MADFSVIGYDPLYTVCSPYVDHPPDREWQPQVLRGEPRLSNSQLFDDVSPQRFKSRQALLGNIESHFDRAASEPALDPYARQRQRAFGLLTSPEVKAAFSRSSSGAPSSSSFRPVTNCSSFIVFSVSSMAARRRDRRGV